MDSRKLVIIDGNAIMHRAYHALPALSNSMGEPIGAVHGMVSMLLRVIQDLEPTNIAVCFDRKEPTFRKKMFEDYQSHRPETDEDLVEQFAKAREVFKTMGIPYYSKAGFEADDLIGTLSKKGEDFFDEVVIVTGDKDIMQLVTEKTHIYYPIRGLGTAMLMREDDVEKKLSVRPNQIVDYKALMGDPSDNYPGVYGIGPKTAQILLGRFETLDNIYDWVDKVSKMEDKEKDAELKKVGVSNSVTDKLIDKKDDAYLSQKLARIVCDVDFAHDLDDMDDWSVVNDKIIELFDKFGFRTLKRRVVEVGEKLEQKNQGSLF